MTLRDLAKLEINNPPDMKVKGANCALLHAIMQERNNVRRLLCAAVKAGRVAKPSQCSVCGSGVRVQGHHEDYTKPYDVEWLCHRCHNIKHNPRPAALPVA
jgi:ribosomal protein S27AE